MSELQSHQSQVEEADTAADWLLPEYWSGYRLGDGNRRSSGGEFVTPNVRAIAEGIRVLEKSIPRSKMVLESLRNGQVFDANAYDPGTVILFDEEFLTAHHQPADRAEPAEPSEQRTKQSAIVQVSLENPVIELHEENFHYVQLLRWGVVVAAEKGHSLLSVLAARVEIRDGQAARVRARMNVSRNLIVTGNVEHDWQENGREYLLRTNGVEVRSYGSPVPARDGKLAFLRQPGFSRT